MKNLILLPALTVLISAGSALAQPPKRSTGAKSPVLDIEPGSFGMARGLRGFTVMRTDGPGAVHTDVTMYSYLYLPTIKAGVAFYKPSMRLDLTGGFGLMTAGGMLGYTLVSDAAFRFKTGRFTTLGPHAGVIYIAPSWVGKATKPEDISISPGAGLVAGVSFTFGRKISLVTSLDDLIMKSLKVTAGHNVAAPAALDLSGWLFQLGILLKFGTAG